MSGPSTYEPKSGLTRWLDTRLPLLRFAHDTMTTFPTPRNLNFWYGFGAILTFMLGHSDRHGHRARDALRGQFDRWHSTASKTSCAT